MTFKALTQASWLGLGNDRLGQVAALLLIAIPALFIPGQAGPDVALSTIAIMFLIRSLLHNDWRWLEEPWVLVGLGIWVYLMLTARYVAYDTAPAIGKAAPFGRFVVFAAALQFWLFVEPQVRRWFVRVLAAVIVFTVLDCLLQYVSGTDIFGQPAQGVRLTGPFEDKVPGAFLHRMAPPLIAIGFALAATSQRWTLRAGAVAGVALVGVTILLTGERAALIMYVFGLCVLFLFLRPARKPLLVAGLIGALLVVGTVAAQPALQKRLIGHTAYDLTKFWERRIGVVLWRGQTVWYEHPVFGAGLKNFRRFCERDDFLPKGPVRTRCYPHPHQIWNEWLAETGIVGFAGFLALLTLWGRSIARGITRLGEDYPLAIGALTSLAIILWPLRTSMSFFGIWLAAIFWLMLGLVLALCAPRGERPPDGVR